MQLQINSIYEKYKNVDTISINGKNYTGEEILEIEDIVTNEVTAKKDKIFDELQKDSKSGIYEDEKENYKFWSNELLKDLGIEKVEGSFFVNIEKRNFISYEGINYMGKTYYTLHQLPSSLYNVEYENANTDKPSFDIKVERNGESKWKISVFNIQHNGYINKWQVKYKLDKQEFWRTSDELSFIVNEAGIYSIKLVNENIETDLKQVKASASAVDKIKETKKLLENNTPIISDDDGKVTIPAGFTIPEESPNNAKEGIIVTDSIDGSTGKSNGNEFVWIPVDPDLKVVGTEKVMAKVSTANGFSGEDDNGRINYEGVFYDFAETESTEMLPSLYGQGVVLLENGRPVHREPDSDLYHDGKTGEMDYLKQIQSILVEETDRYTDMDTFKNTMQEDYNEMIESVKTYGGFYVGRYEMSLEGGKSTSSKVGTAATSGDWGIVTRWYGLYSYGKKFTNTKNSVKSSMIWGSQYDAMLNYALTGNDKDKVTATGNGHYGKPAVDTGTTPNDKIINIFDLEGNYGEWTLEAYTNDYRTMRGRLL